MPAAPEVEELGAVAGKTFLHLQCHFGLGTLSWARRGAIVTGVDFSPKAIALARSLATEVGIDARVVESNGYDLPAALHCQGGRQTPFMPAMLPMNWLIPFFVVIALLAVLEAIYFIRRWRDRVIVRRLGVFSLVLVPLASILFAFAYQDKLVLSPEFGVLMVEGRLARDAMLVMIVLLATVAGLGWNVMRASPNGRRRLWLIALGVVVGIAAASRVWPLNEQEPGAALITAYDLWWPPLAIWLAVCIADTVMLVLGIGAVTVRLLAALGAVGVVAVAASQQPVPADPHSAAWPYVALVGVPLALLFALRLSSAALDRMAGKVLRVALAAGAAGVAVSVAFARVRVAVMPVMTSTWAWEAMLGVIGIVVVLAVLRERRSPVADALVLPALSLRRWLCAAACALILVVLVLAFDVLPLSAAASVALVLAAWLLTSDVVVRGPISSPTEAPIVELPLGPWLHPRAWVVGARQSGPALAAAGRSLGGLVSVPDKWAGVTWKALVGLACLIALSEVVNLGKSIIQPFTASTPAAMAPKDATTKDALNELGRAIGDRAINSIGQLSQELRTDVLFVPQGAIRRPVQVVGAGGSTAALDAALAKSSDIDISGVKIPIGLLAAPVQIPMRAILGVRMISGVVHVDGQHYVLLVTSNAGASWRVDADATTPSEAVKSLGDQLAFQLLTSVDSSLRAARVTSSWPAFQTFRAGLGEWREYQVTRTPAALSRAIQDFRSATRSDTRFALAHYWLALALQENGQRDAAVAAFRRSIAADPDFTSGYLALAVALSNASTDYPAAVDPPDESEARAAGRAEARWRLHQFISFPPKAAYSPRDRAVGYAALCHDAYQAADDATITRFHLAYFYCARARAAYTRLDPAGRSDTRSRQAEADIENELAVLLDRVRPNADSVVVKGWHCDASGAAADSIDGSGRVHKRIRGGSPFTRSALEYYARAVALVSENPVYRCNYAMAAYVLGQRAPMAQLENDPAAHVAAGNRYLERAKFNPVFYAAALREHDEAMTRNPSHVAALLGYASTFWQWRLRDPRATGEGPRPTLEIGAKAEAAARKAVALVAGRTALADEIVARSTLGEALLALSRPEEAIETIEKALTLTIDDDATFDEVRWDLAQAKRCASANDERRKGPVDRIRALRADAARLLEIVRDHERERGRAVFGSDPSLLDPGRHQEVCTRDPAVLLDTRPTGPEHYVLDRTTYSPYHFCAWLGVTAEVVGRQGGSAPRLGLHVWGGDVDRWLDAAQAEPVFLSSAPRDEHDYYFVQLFAKRAGESVEPVSAVYPLTTFANGKDGRCARNQIALVFRPAR